MSNRKEITEFLSDRTINRFFSGMGKYWAREVTLNYGTKDCVRVDFMQFCPPKQTSIGAIEKGDFICYEIKSSVEDFRSGHGMNFIGDKNYLIMPYSVFESVKDEIPYGVGVQVPVDIVGEYVDMADIEDFVLRKRWVTLKSVKPAKRMERKYAMTELLFSMLRAKK